MRIATLLASTAIALALVTTAATAQSAMPGQTPVPSTMPTQTPIQQTAMPNANQTPMPSANGTMPNANQTPEGSRNTNLPRADGTMAVTPTANPGVPPSSPLCKAGAMTTNCNPIPNPSCLPGQATTPTGTQCPSPTVP